MMKVLFQDHNDLEVLSKDELEKKMGISWLDSLAFQSERFQKKIEKESAKAMKRKDLTVRGRWLGVRFQKEISAGYMPGVSIRYIDQEVGYGVFAEETISAGAYIGEYTGLIRKRRRRYDRKNDYCFEYTIGDWDRNPFIIDAKDQGNFTRWINHSEEPNLDTLSVYVDGMMHIIFVALKPIKVGTQITYHYGDTFWKKRRHSVQLIES